VTEIPRWDTDGELVCGKISILRRGANLRRAMSDGSGIPSPSLLKLLTVNAGSRSTQRLSVYQALSLPISLLSSRRAGTRVCGRAVREAENGKSRQRSLRAARRPGMASVASHSPEFRKSRRAVLCWAVCNLQHTPAPLVTAVVHGRSEGCTARIGGDYNVGR